VASAGDVDNEGYDDDIVGAPYWESNSSDQPEGEAYQSNMYAQGVFVSYGVINHSVSAAPTWINPETYRASFDITSLIPRDTYSITVSSAPDLDSIQIAPNSNYTFTVDYAGAIGDTTPPPPPAVQACASSNQATLSASWTAHDPESAITLYRYAIGTSPGGIDVVNWTNTSSTSFLRSGLNLTPGQTYYVSVKARNEGGLWSAFGASPGVEIFETRYLPMIFNQTSQSFQWLDARVGGTKVAAGDNVSQYVNLPFTFNY
jgi:hypothetical protein